MLTRSLTLGLFTASMIACTGSLGGDSPSDPATTPPPTG